MKKFFLFFLSSILVALIFGLMKFLPMLQVANSFAAKNACSCYYLSNRKLEEIHAQELGAYPLNITKISVDESTQTVYSSILGLTKRKAKYKKGLGCQIIHGVDDYQINYLRKETLKKKDSLRWPYGDVIDLKNLTVKQDSLIDLAFDYAFLPNHYTRSLLVYKNDTIVKEKYAMGYDEHTPQMGWSMTKSISNALIGILVQQGKLDIHSNPNISAWSKDDRSKITIDNLLKMNSGLDWEEVYDKPSDPNSMLWLEENAVDFAISQPLMDAPGSGFIYSSGTTNILSGILRDQFDNHTDYLAFPYDSLFDKLGMHSAQLETDEAGNYILSSFCFATPRDWAKFGILYLNNGNWNGEQILDSKWVAYSRTPSNKEKNYSAQFWLNADGHLPDVPKDLYSANGYQGQYVYIIPSEDMVIVRTGLSKDFDQNQLLKEIIDAVK